MSTLCRHGNGVQSEGSGGEVNLHLEQKRMLQALPSEQPETGGRGRKKSQ